MSDYNRLSDAEQWELAIPEMGLMALARNLRNFDQAGVSKEFADQVEARLRDESQVIKSRMFPFRFFSAWNATDSVRWAPALEAAMQASVANVPEFPGKTLVLVDTSGSMQSTLSDRGSVMRCDVAALFGAVLASRNPGNVDLHIYATGVAPFQVKPGASILRTVEQMRSKVGSVGHGTNTWEAVRSTYTDHDRVVILTDEQSHDSGRRPNAWLHIVNLAGYQYGTAPKDGRTFWYTGFSDKMFTLMPLNEHGASGKFPWE